jgi:citrate lyase beta subunit
MSELAPPSPEQPFGRSFHFIPATLLDRVGGRLSTMEPDMFVFDLEDSVRPDDRDDAREVLADFINDGGVPEDAGITVRVNNPRSRWWQEDLEAFDGVADALVIPQVISVDELPFGGKSSLIPILETIQSIDFMPGITEANAERGERKAPAVIFGKDDLLVALGQINPADNSTNPQPSTDFRVNPLMRDIFSYIRWSTPDGNPYKPGVIEGASKRLEWEADGMDDLRDECELVRAAGAVGKVSIHTSQIGTINQVFDPHYPVAVAPRSAPEKPELRQDISDVPNLEEKLANARRMVEAVETNTRPQNIAVWEIDGKTMMVAPPAYRLVKSILARAEADTRIV